MKVTKSPEFYRDEQTPVVMAIGSFDGLHRGHQKIIKQAVKIAAGKKKVSGVYSFNPHPLKILAPDSASAQIISEKRKINKLEKMGVDFYFQQKFTRQFSRLSFEKFIKDILVNKIGVSQIIVGDDFRFGYQGQGNVKLLKKYGRKYNFQVNIISPFEIEGHKVSSSYIRKLIKQGEMTQIPRLLGEYFQLEGLVVHGEGRGRELGYPTANLRLLIDYVIPQSGVYAGYTYYQKQKYKSLANIGYNPTFASKDFSLEIHILDLNEDINIYGQKIKFEFRKFIRGEIKFDQIKELKQQIKKDILYTRDILC